MLRDEIVLLRAHGEPPNTYQWVLEDNMTLLDARWAKQWALSPLLMGFGMHWHSSTQST